MKTFTRTTAAAMLTALLALTALLPADVHAKRIMHDSGKCIGPAFTYAGGQTPLVLHDRINCAYSERTYLDFGYVNTLLIHRESQKCVQPADVEGGWSTDDITPLVLDDCSKRDPDMRFEVDADGVLTHFSGVCIGDINEESVLRPNCRSRRPQYTMVDLNPQKLAQRPLKYGSLIHRTSGLCVSSARRTDWNGEYESRFVLGKECHKYALLGNYALKHMDTGACVHSTDHRRIELRDNCDIESARFRHLESGALQSRQFKTCIHPKGGAKRPRQGTRLVLHRNCRAGERIAFDFEN